MSKSPSLVRIEQEPVRVFGTAHFHVSYPSCVVESGPELFGPVWFPFRIQLSSDSHTDYSRVWRNAIRDFKSLSATQRQNDPLSDIHDTTKIDAVLLWGRMFDRTASDAMLAR